MQNQEHLFGCEPNFKKPELLKEIEASSVPWDASDKPSLCTWESLKPFLEEKAEKFDNRKRKFWWEIARELGHDPEVLITPSQGNIGSCAGVSYFERCFVIQLLKQIGNGFSEQQVEKVNALPTWLMSKNWSRWGGQTISAVTKEGTETGVFPARLVGDYSASWYEKQSALNHVADAEKRQMGACLVPGDIDAVEVIRLALKAGHVVEIGNSTAIADGTNKDENGMDTVRCAGYWSHATMFSEYKIVNGSEYFRWENSHGLIYENDCDEPRIGGWMTLETLRQFTSSTFCDLTVVTYVESPYQEGVKPSLNPTT